MGAIGIFPILLVLVVVVVLPWAAGKTVAGFIRDDSRKMILGVIMALVGAAILIYGVISLISALDAQPKIALHIFIDANAIVIGIFFVIFGLTTLLSRGWRASKSVQGS